MVDEGRRVRITKTYDSIQHAFEQTAKFYRRSALEQSDDYVEIWVEKDALAGVMWDATSDYDVPLMVSRGMPCITFLHGTALAIQSAAERNKRSYIYQFGDHDPSGVLIPKTIERRLDEMCEKLDVAAPTVKRVALTEKQIERYRPPNAADQARRQPSRCWLRWAQRRTRCTAAADAAQHGAQGHRAAHLAERNDGAARRGGL